MRETDFIENNREKWERYEASLARKDQDPDLLNELYVHTTDDLSYSRTFYPNRSVRVYLNGLAQRTFLNIYRGRRGEVNRFFTFWSDELPRVVFANRRALLISLLLFVLSMLIGVLSYRIDPEFAEVILGETYVRMTEANIEEGDPMRVYKMRDQFGMALHITFNNITVALLTFVAGALFCVGSVVMLVRNGVMVGVFQYFFYAQGDYSTAAVSTEAGYGAKILSWLFTAGGSGLEQLFLLLVHLGSDASVFRESLLTIWIHGALEISSIVIAGGAGLVLGSGLLFPGTLTRLQAFSRSARDGLKIMLGTVPLFIIAGFLEGYVTRQTDLPDALRLGLIVVCFLFIGWYYVVYPRWVVKNRKAEDRRVIARSSPASEEAPPLNRVRSIGEQLAMGFAIFRDNLGRILGSCLLLSIGYCCLSLYFADGSAANRYHFDAFLLADFKNMHELATSFGRGRSFTFTLLVAVGFYLMFRLAFSVVGRMDQIRRPATPQREIVLGLISLGVAMCFAFSGVATLLLTFLLLPFLLVLAYARYTDRASVTETFRLVYTNLGSSYGPFLLIICVAAPTLALLDTVVGGQFFTFFDWVIYTDESNIDERNVALQAFVYYFLFALLFVSWAITFAVSFGSMLEIQHAAGLREQIRQVGRKRRIRGMEVE